MRQRVLVPRSSPKKPTADDSYIGGTPRLPAAFEAPQCEICRRSLTFFFRLRFPDSHPYHGFSLSLFAATNCAHEEFLIPEMPSGELRGADVSAELLRTYQRNFRVYITSPNDEVPRGDLTSWIEYEALREIGQKSRRPTQWATGSPIWLLEDESPRTLAGQAPLFLCQVPLGYRFRTRAGAPRQMEWVFFEEKPSRDTHYELFLGNQVYIWGTPRNEEFFAYVLTQR